MPRRYAAYIVLAVVLLGCTGWLIFRAHLRNLDLQSFLVERAELHKAFHTPRKLPAACRYRLAGPDPNMFAPANPSGPFPPDAHISIVTRGGRSYQNVNRLAATFHISLNEELMQDAEGTSSAEVVAAQLLDALFASLPDGYAVETIRSEKRPTASPHYGDMVILEQIARSSTNRTALHLQIRLSTNLTDSFVTSQIHEGFPALPATIDPIAVPVLQYRPASTLPE